MKKTLFIILVSVILLVILHISYLTAPEDSFTMKQKPVKANPETTLVLKKTDSKNTSTSESKLYGWLKASISFTLKRKDGEDYGLTFRWYK